MNVAVRTRGLAVTVVLAVCSGVAIAQSGGEYRISRQAVASGGGQTAGGEFSAEVTLAQPQAASQADGEWRLRGGFQVGTTKGAPPPVSDAIFRDGFED